MTPILRRDIALLWQSLSYFLPRDILWAKRQKLATFLSQYSDLQKVQAQAQVQAQDSGLGKSHFFLWQPALGLLFSLQLQEKTQTIADFWDGNILPWYENDFLRSANSVLNFTSQLTEPMPKAAVFFQESGTHQVEAVSDESLMKQVTAIESGIQEVLPLTKSSQLSGAGQLGRFSPLAKELLRLRLQGLRCSCSELLVFLSFASLNQLGQFDQLSSADKNKEITEIISLLSCHIYDIFAFADAECYAEDVLRAEFRQGLRDLWQQNFAYDGEIPLQ